MGLTGHIPLTRCYYTATFFPLQAAMSHGMFALAFFRNNISRYEVDFHCSPASTHRDLSVAFQWSRIFSYEK